MAENYSLARESKGLLIIPPGVSWERKNDHPYEKFDECRLFIQIILASLLILFSSTNHFPLSKATFLPGAALFRLSIIPIIHPYCAVGRFEGGSSSLDSSLPSSPSSISRLLTSQRSPLR